MGIQKSENRIKAKELYLKSRKTKKLKDIAADLKVSENLIRKWKHQDKWDLEVLPKKHAGNGNVGCPPGANKEALKGNKNAAGSRGGQAPRGNKNAVKTGEYEKILFNTLSIEELKLIANINNNKADLLKNEIALLTVREYRIMKRIEGVRSKDLKIENINVTEIRDGEGDLMQEHITTLTLSEFEILNRLEEALTRVQDKKIKAIESLSRIEIAAARLELDKEEDNSGADNISAWLQATSIISKKDLKKLFADDPK